MARSAATVAGSRFGRLEGRLKWFLSVPLKRQTYRNVAYLLLAFPLGLTYFVVLSVGLSLGIGLAIVLVGVGILAATFAVGLCLAAFDRRLTTWLLAVDIEPRTTLAGSRRRDRLRSLLTDRKTWSALLYLPAQFVLGVGSFVFMLTLVPLAISLLFVPFYYNQPGLYVGVVPDRAPEIHWTLNIGWDYLLVGFETVVTIGHWQITTLPQALLTAFVGLLLCLLTLHALNAIARLWARFATVMLANSYDPIAGLANSGQSTATDSYP